jgi:NAD(P)-dependent dehydrogenase (short-subunit alcohol dehydrogenase family)
MNGMPQGQESARSNQESGMQKSDKTALVTGGAKRIGAAIVEDLAKNGFAMAIHCNRSAAEANALAAKINGRGGRAIVLPADLTEMSQAERLIGDAAAALGPVRLLVNNASIFRDDTADEPDFELWDRHFAVHVKAPALLTACLASQLPEGADGLVVNMIDQRVWKLSPGYFSYTLSKSALWTATQTLAQAFAPRVRVNAVGPGPALISERQSPADFQAQLDGLIMKRGPELAEFGATIRYLWDARSVTGQMIALDGGQHLAWQTPDVTGIVE